MRRRSAKRSVAAWASATTRVMIAPTVRQATRSSCPTADLEVWVASQAAVSSEAKYRRMEVRAWWSCGLGELLVVGQATKQAVEVGLGIAPVERNGGLLVAVLEGQ